MISIFYCFLDPVVKPRGDTVGFTGPRNDQKIIYKLI
ncbi:palindromic element RPE4 domain-containing protein [Rickettsia japonica]|uniref:Palindromic element RPE4 domain-containing protein n=1 Tax=Rickettsia japonica TaxID=35790 RepID=A0ABN5P3H8_RICJA|nr:palindromic element RPE4 domain-containing protein [Rickettsia japonica]QHE25512.1 palindromic element RPE4 domain-containing protein [Rickettsia japonica]